WDRIVVLAAEHGGHLPATPDAGALAAFLVSRRDADRDTFEDLSLAVVKLLGKGEYALSRPGQEPPGHFALGVRDYAHSTAPNRRFPDLITQRLVKSALADRPPAYGADELKARSQLTRQTERRAARQRPLVQQILRMFLERGAPVPIQDIVAQDALAALDADDLIRIRNGLIDIAYPFSAAPTPFRVRFSAGR